MRRTISGVTIPAFSVAELRAGVFIFLLGLFLVSSNPRAVRAGDAATGSLADALITADGDANRWRHCGLFALGIEIGIPERTLLSAWPRARFETLPPKVLETLRLGSGGISAWLTCLAERRPTRIGGLDPVTGGPAENGEKMTCGDAALMILQAIVPVKSQPAPRDTEEIIAGISKSAPEWEQNCRTLSATDRMRKWFEQSDAGQQNWLLLPLAIQTRYAPAYPLLEASFLRQAKSDASLPLVLAYIRHRRKAAATFESQFNAIVRQGKIPENTQFFLRVCHLLVRNDSLEGDIQDWLAGRINLETLYELSARSVIFPLIFADADRSIAEANLRSAVAAADREHSIEKRSALILLAQGATNILVNEVIPRCSSLANQPVGGSHAPEWKEVVVHLSSLLTDRRITTDERSVATPAEAAAQVVWHLWGPNTDSMQTLFHGAPPDWRGFEIGGLGSTRSLLVDSANDFLNHPEERRPRQFPTAEAARLAAQFTAGTAVDWRKKLDALRWDQRLLVQAQLQHDKELAVRFWPRLVELVDYQFAEPKKSPTFETFWRDKLAAHNLDGTTWAALRDWVVAEAAAGRWWKVIGESSPCRPGVSLFVFSAPEKGPSPSGDPEFLAELDGRHSMFVRAERDKITPAGLKILPTPWNDLGYPTAAQALAQQAKRTAKDNRVNTHGFTFHMMAVPGK